LWILCGKLAVGIVGIYMAEINAQIAELQDKLHLLMDRL
jgi:hypothetical protein